MEKRIIATLHDMSHIPPDCFYRGDGVVDYIDDDVKNEHDEKIKDKLVEIDFEGKEKFRKPGYKDKIKDRNKIMKSEAVMVGLGDLQRVSE